MAAKRHRLAQRRKTLGFTQEVLAERLGVDSKTVRRWESGETEDGPQPWLRPKLARYLQVSAEQLEELLREDADDPGKREPLPGSVPSQLSDERENAELLNLDMRTGVFVPVIVDGRPALIPLDKDTGATDWDAMSPPNRRSVLGYGLAAATASMLPVTDAARTFHQPAAPLTLSAPPQASWAAAIYDAVLDPMSAARQATVCLEGLEDGAHDLGTLRMAVDRAMRVSLSSDYGALERSLPNLIGRAEAATMQGSR